MGKTFVSVVRVLMIIFNIIFALIGLAILGLSIYLFVEYGQSDSTSGNLMAIPCVILAVLGGIPVLLSLCACWGALRYNRCCLGTYFTFLLIVFAAEIAIGVAGIIFKNKLRNIVDAALKAGVQDAITSDAKLHWIDLLELFGNCCGYSGPVDYLSALKPVPPSCCKGTTCPITTVFTGVPGCKDRLASLQSNYVVLCAILITLAIVQLIGLVFSMLICCSARERTQSVYYQQVQG